MFGCSRSGYYAWLKRLNNPNPRLQEKLTKEAEIKECMRQICKELGHVPGRRGFRTHLWRDHNKVVSEERCARLMKQMNLIAKNPEKDAYKHQATHNHPCDCPPNEVNQNFYLGVRKVILTDITYLYYGKTRTTFYLCAFKDAYTKEILGRASAIYMNVNLVKEAYNDMMKNHGSELKKNITVYIHSDQGSQYLSTTFQELLTNDGFIQSVSGRGNSQDNAPMESFFARMKTAILDLVALCEAFETAQQLVYNYIDAYNTKQYQYNLAGLTPVEFYSYITSGIYPCDSYYGIKASEMMSINELVKVRLDRQKQKNEKRREKSAKINEERNMLHKTPVQIIARDQKMIRREIKTWEEQKALSEDKIRHFHEILDESKKAAHFISKASPDILDKLRNPQEWKNYPELHYVTMMKEMF